LVNPNKDAKSGASAAKCMICLQNQRVRFGASTTPLHPDAIDPIIKRPAMSLDLQMAHSTERWAVLRLAGRCSCAQVKESHLRNKRDKQSSHPD
jgi:hypothetical protein